MKAAGTHLTALELAQVLMTMPMQTEVVIGENAQPIISAEPTSGGRVTLIPDRFAEESWEALADLIEDVLSASTIHDARNLAHSAAEEAGYVPACRKP